MPDLVRNSLTPAPRGRARDPAGHIWVFGQTVRTVSIEKMEKASGVNMKAAP